MNKTTNLVQKNNSQDISWITKYYTKIVIFESYTFVSVMQLDLHITYTLV